ncbi:hypothetical protein KTD26_27320, partial [Burkholderia multivorans]|uniref:hypothetical protein n=1 Tax=Burkholderia multivorans TaxID=87883 RepID=UPI001C2485CC
MVFLEEGARPGMTVPKLLAPQLLSVGRAGYSGTDYGNVPQTVEGWDGGCGIDYATLRSWSMLDFEGERFRAAASTQ